MSRTRTIAVAVIVAAIAVVGIRRCGGERSGGTDEAGAGSGTGVAARDRTRAEAPAWFGVAAAGGRRIAGTVFVGGVPAAATISLASAATDAGAAAVVDGAARADGRFDLGTHRAGRYRLFASAPGAVPGVVSVDCELADADVEVFLERCRTTVTGDVRDASGGAIAGAVISTAGFALATTDASGRYELCLGSGNGTLVARADGYAAVGREVEAWRSVELDFDLVPEATVVVHVVDPQRRPVAGAMVRAEPAIDAIEDGAQPAIGVTDATGAIELRGLAPSTYQLTAVSPGLTTATPVTHDPIAGQAGDVTIELTAAVTITGRIIEAGAPVSGVRIRWTVDDAERGRAISAADGAFSIPDVPAGPGRFGVDEDVFLIGPNEYAAAAGAPPVDVEIKRQHVVRGKVVRAGKPVGGARVAFLRFGGGVTTHADGSFTLPFPAPGDLEIEAQSDTHGAFGTATVHLEAGVDLDGVVVELAWGGTIAGIVVDQAGAPVPGVALTYECSALNDVGRGVTGPDGTFVADKLRGGCTYAPTLRLDGGRLGPAAGEWPEIDLVENGRAEGVRLVAKVERTTITGVVVDAAGAGVADVLIQTTPGVRETRTDVDGRFAVASTQPGPFRIEARASGTRTAHADKVAAGTRDLRMVLLAPGAVHVTCAAGWESRLTLASMIRGQARRITCGATVRPLAPERYAVFGNDFATQVTVEPGATAEVAVTPVGRTDVEVTLTGMSPDGVTCAGWWFYLEGEANIEPGVAATGSVVKLSLRRGNSRIVCRGPGIRGDLRLVVGDAPMRVTVKLAAREPR